MIYLDTSAAMKLVRIEAHSFQLSDWLRRHPAIPVLSSVLIEVELVRATRRSALERMERAEEVLRGIGTVTLSAHVITSAAGYADADLRSLDAIHLATAEHIVAVTGSPLEAFVAYDDRLVDAGRNAGFEVVSPGVSF